MLLNETIKGGRFGAVGLKQKMTRRYPIKGVQEKRKRSPGMCQGPEATCTQESGEECRELRVAMSMGQVTFRGFQRRKN